MIELSVSLASNGVVKVPGYEQLVRFGYTKNRGVYRLAVTATGEWEGLTIRAFWHVPGGKDPASSLVVDGSVDVPASVTAQPGNGCITFEGSDGTKTVTSADLRYRVSANSGTEDGTMPEPGTPAWQQLVDAVHTDAAAAEQAKNDAQTAASEAATSAGNADQSAQEAAGSLQELKDGIASGDFKGEQGPQGPIGPVGPQGEQGPQGPKGETGPAVALDTTLTHEGEAADAKATGDAISAVKVRQNILVGTETGNPIAVDDAFSAPLCGLTVYGKSTQDGTPTPDAPVPIVSAGDGGSVMVKVTGKNLLDPTKNAYNTYKPYGLTITYLGDNRVHLKGTYQEDDGGFVILDTQQKLLAGKGLKITGFTVEGTKQNYTFYGLRTENETVICMQAQFAKGNVIDMTVAIVVSGTTPPTAYSPYREQLLTLPTPTGLPGIPVTSGGTYTDPQGQQWVCDEVDLERGVKVQRVNAVDLSTCVITGSTNLAATKRLSIRLPLKGKDYTVKALCNRLPYFVSFTSDAIHFYVDIANAQVFIPIGAKNPEEGEYILFYVLDAPIETPLTPAEIAAYKALIAYAPDTVVQASDGAGIQLGYQRDVNIAIKRIEDAVASMTTT